jgi:2-polyprenyl-6-methoxyphenol hydroxylase-like FAD-dependent oxidoreductase
MKIEFLIVGGGIGGAVLANLLSRKGKRVLVVEKETTPSKFIRPEVVRVRRLWGHAKKYGIAGAMLMGDAAHPVSPAGGQGANMSVADATAMAELLMDGGGHRCNLRTAAATGQ